MPCRFVVRTPIWSKIPRGISKIAVASSIKLSDKLRKRACSSPPTAPRGDDDKCPFQLSVVVAKRQPSFSAAPLEKIDALTQEVERLRASAAEKPALITEPEELNALFRLNSLPAQPFSDDISDSEENINALTQEDEPTSTNDLTVFQQKNSALEQEMEDMRKRYEAELYQAKAALAFSRDRASNAAGLAWTQQKIENKLRRKTMHLQTSTQLVEVLEGQIADLKEANASLTEHLQRYIAPAKWDPLMLLTRSQSRESMCVPQESRKVARQILQAPEMRRNKTLSAFKKATRAGRAFKKKKGTKSKRSKTKKAFKTLA